MKKNIFSFLLICLYIMAGNNTIYSEGLRVVSRIGFTPYIFYSDNQPAGFYYDLIKKISINAKLKIKEIKLYNFHIAKNLIETGKADLMLGFAYSHERAKMVDFSIPIASISYAIFIKKSLKIKKMEDLTDKRILVIQGNRSENIFKEYRIRANITTVENSLGALLRLSEGNYDCLILPRYHGEYLIKKMNISALRIAVKNLLTLDVSIAVKKGNYPLLNKINQEIALLHSSGEYYKIYNKWFGEYKFSNEVHSKVNWLLCLITFFFALIFLWIWRANKNISRILNLKNRRLRKAENEIKNMDNRLRFAFETSEDFYWELKPLTKDIYLNENFYKISGWKKNSILTLNRVLNNLIHPEDRKIVRHQFQPQNLISKKTIRAEFRLKCRSGNYIWLMIKGKTCEMSENNFPSIIAGIGRDITQNKLQEKFMIEQNQALEMSVDSKTAELKINEKLLKSAGEQLIRKEKLVTLGKLVGGISHEINTPLGICVSAASYLKEQNKAINVSFQSEDMDKEELENFIKIVNEATEILLININRATELMKSFKKVAIDQIGEEKRKFNLLLYFKDVIKSLQPMLHNSSNQIVLECDENIEITSYPGAFAQVLINLITNSLVHGFREKKSGKIFLKVKIEHGYLILIYEDNGDGIPDEIVEKIYDMLFTTSSNQESNGLGMYIVHELITHKLIGEIKYDGEFGKGARFVIKVPIKELE